MGPFLGRVVGYIFLSWALALAVGPFEDTVSRDRMVERSISGQTQTLPERSYQPVNWFRMARYPSAAGCLVIGLLAVSRLYRRRPGINLNPGWLGLIGDIIVSLFLALGAYTIIDYLLHVYEGTHLVLGEPLAAQVVLVGFVPATLILAAFTAGQFSQSVEVDEKGITVHRPGKAKLVEWEAIKGFELNETYTLVGRVGLLVPSKVQTKLEIDVEPWGVSLVEPGLTKTKQQLLVALTAHAPEKLQANLEQIKREW